MTVLRIIIKSIEENKNINVRLPMCAITTLIRFVNIENKVDVDKDEYVFLNNLFKNNNKKNIIKGLKYLNQNYKGLALVDVEDASGDIVKIEI